MSTGNAREAAAKICASLRAAGDPNRAIEVKRYLKSDLEFLGMSMSTLRAIVTGSLRDRPGLTRRDLIALARALWREPVFERRIAAVEILDARKALLEPSDVAVIETFIRHSQTWALVDPLAVNVCGDLVERFPELEAVLDGWAVDDDFWIRRSALLALLIPLRRGEGDFERFGRYAEAMLEEREFFIRKAIGWVLRETSKKRADLVYRWLKPRASRASGVTMREAVKYLPPKQRNEILAAYKP